VSVSPPIGTARPGSRALRVPAREVPSRAPVTSRSTPSEAHGVECPETTQGGEWMGCGPVRHSDRFQVTRASTSLVVILRTPMSSA
jgi:hypothetical protein